MTIVYFTADTIDAASETLGAPMGTLRMATAVVKIAVARSELPRHRMNCHVARKVLTVSYAGEGTYVATLTDDGTVPNPCDVILRREHRDRTARIDGAALDREIRDEESEWS